MNHYRYAKLYLATLAFAACLMFALGVLSLVCGSFLSIADFTKAVQARSRVLPIDTQTLGELLNNSRGKVFAACELGNSSPDNVLPQPKHFQVEKNAVLTVEQRQRFELYVDEVARSVTELKRIYARNFEDSLDVLIEAARDAASKARQETNIPFKQSVMDSGMMSTTKNRHSFLYNASNLDGAEVAQLVSAADFLKTKIEQYTPNKKAIELGETASQHLMVILEVLTEDLKSLNTERLQNAWNIVAENISSDTHDHDKSLKAKEERIRSFVDNLVLCRKLVGEVALSNWLIDAELARLTGFLNDHKLRSYQDSRRHLRQGLIRFATSCGVFFIFLILCLSFLVTRDFMCALIDIATNTSLTTSALTRLAVSTE